MPIGIIGLGRLGSALVQGLFLNNRSVIIYGYNRTKEKGLELKNIYNELNICNSETEVISKCEIVFIWTKPEDAISILENNSTLINKEQPILISSTRNIPLHKYTNRWAECYPNVNMSIGKGVTIIHYPPSLPDSDRTLINDVMAKIGSLYSVSAENMSFYSALSSCGPALYATMFETFADIMSSHQGFDRNICRRIVIETVMGTLTLQESENIDSSKIVYRVAHPGGPSEAGVNYLRLNLPDIYEKMLKTMNKW